MDIALKILKKLDIVSDTIHNDIELKEAIKQLEELKIEDTYMLNKIEESLSMGNKAQSLATVEVYQILKNRNKDKIFDSMKKLDLNKPYIMFDKEYTIKENSVFERDLKSSQLIEYRVIFLEKAMLTSMTDELLLKLKTSLDEEIARRKK